MWQVYIDNVHKIALQFIHEYKKSGMSNIKYSLHYINNCFGLVKSTNTNKSLGGLLGKQDTDFKQFWNSAVQGSEISEESEPGSPQDI